MNRPRILIVDDDPLFRSLLTSMLNQDFAVIVACDGAEGYYRALEHPPQLAIVDIQMSGWDGLRTLKAFRSHYLLARTPVMMLTSDASRQTVMAAVQGGASDYVIKTSLSRDEFLRKVYRLVGTTLPLPPATLDLHTGSISPHDAPTELLEIGADPLSAEIPVASGVDAAAQAIGPRSPRQSAADDWDEPAIAP